MQSTIDKAREVIAKNQDLLTVFEELDRTGRFKKRSYKVRATFTIDENIINEFRNYCRRNSMNMSAMIESLIKKVLKR